MIPAVKKIFADATSGNLWTNRTPQKLSRMGVNGTTPGIIGHACGISETSSLDLIGIIGATASPYGLNKIQKIWNIWKSIFLDLRHSNKLDTSINQKFTNNMVAPPVFDEVLGDKLSNSSVRDLYMRCIINLVADSVNLPAPQFVDLGLSTINVLNKGDSLCTPATRVGGPVYVAHGSAPDHNFEKVTAVR